MDINNITAVYFIGAGGIGMSALIRYFLSKGKKVGGYDKTPSGLTEQLNYEGAAIHYEDNVDLIPDDFTDPVKTLVVYTPAVPEDHSELCYFRGNGFEVMKRARVLGEITGCNRGLCVAGTHGKTTTSSMVAHLLKQSHVDCNAFLGGILKNYDSNLMLSDKSDLTVIEADEFDRSFHWLKPYMAVITAADPDHLDIYGTPEAYRESFEHFTSLIRPDGCLLMKQGINVTPRLQEGVKFYTYTGAFDAKELSTFNFQLSTGSPDFYAENVRIGGGEIFFDFVGPDVRIPDIQLGVPVKVNVENGVAAIALAWLNGVTPEEIAISILAEIIQVKRMDREDKRVKNRSDLDFDVLKRLAEEPDEPKAVVTVIESKGSSPRGAGAKMIVYRDGRILGSIGGGCSEAAVLGEARSLIGSGRYKVVHVDLTGEAAEDEGMVCGGIMDVLVEDFATDREPCDR